MRVQSYITDITVLKGKCGCYFDDFEVPLILIEF